MLRPSVFLIHYIMIQQNLILGKGENDFSILSFFHDLHVLHGASAFGCGPPGQRYETQKILTTRL